MRIIETGDNVDPAFRAKPNGQIFGLGCPPRHFEDLFGVS